MSDPGPETSGAAAAPAGESPSVTTADILVDATSGEAAGAATGESAPTAAAAETPSPDAQESAALNFADVFPGVDLTDPNLGAYLKVEIVGGNTVVSLDADGGGGAAAVPVVTLEGVTEVTLQQLLNNGQDIT